MRSLLAPLLLPLAALIAALVRWALQGSGNLYTSVDKRFYVPDPDLGWTVSPETPTWLGLEVCALIAALVVGLLIAGWIIRKLEARRGRPLRVLRGARWLVAALPLIVSIAAFASGGRPAGAIDQLPASAASISADAGITGALVAPAGAYAIVAHPGTSVTAQLKAGGDSFDARFGDVRGTWTGDPGALSAPLHVDISVAADSIDTGIGERSKHARESYLHADQFPRITVTIDRVVAARQDAPSAVAFRATGSLALIGKTHAIDITGTVIRPDAAGLARLGLTGDVLIVHAAFAIPVRETALAPDAGDFDAPQIPLVVSLVLHHTGG